MSKEFQFEEILKDGLLGEGQYVGEVFCLMDPDRFKFKVDPRIKSVEAVPVEGERTKCMIVTRVHGIGEDRSNELHGFTESINE